MAGVTARTPQEIFNSRGKALLAKEIDALVAHFANNAVFITPSGVRQGHQGVREAFTQILADLPHAKGDLKTTAFAGDVLFLEWSADSDTNRAEHQVDTFSFRGGLIQTQTVRHTLTPHN